MKPDQEFEAGENDALWRLLGDCSPKQAGPRFVDDVVRKARLDSGSSQPWWSRWLAPVPAASLAGLAAALVIGFFVTRPPEPPPQRDSTIALSAGDSLEIRMDHLQEVLETELLFAAVEHLDEFSDDELLVLIGF